MILVINRHLCSHLPQPQKRIFSSLFTHTTPNSSLKSDSNFFSFVIWRIHIVPTIHFLDCSEWLLSRWRGWWAWQSPHHQLWHVYLNPCRYSTGSSLLYGPHHHTWNTSGSLSFQFVGHHIFCPFCFFVYSFFPTALAYHDYNTTWPPFHSSSVTPAWACYPSIVFSTFQ